jgi:hypothetical protein
MRVAMVSGAIGHADLIGAWHLGIGIFDAG